MERKNLNVIETTLLLQLKGIENSEEAESVFDMLIRPKFNVVEHIYKEYENGGLSHVCLLEESTLAMHYYPEYMIMTVIISSCENEGEVFEKFRSIIAEVMYLYETTYQIMQFTPVGLQAIDSKYDILY